MKYTAPVLWRLSQELYKLPENYSKTGKVVSFSIVQQPPELFKIYSPYIIAVIELVSGQKISTQIVDCDLKEIKIGLPVQTTLRKLFVETSKSIVTYGIKFKPMKEIT